MQMVNTIDKGMLAEDAAVKVEFYVSSENAFIIQRLLSIPLLKWMITGEDTAKGFKRTIHAPYEGEV
jgi:hypothetical protein